jgi:serine/threonine-protein kinase
MDDRVEQAGARIGSVLDGAWTIDSLLGIGGMAAVYGATAGDERVAIKVLHPDLTRSQRALERFRREGEALRAARHPAVPCVRGEGTTDDGCPYLMMELLPGETVEARRRRFGGRLAWAEVVQIALAVLDVLETVHARGLLHRDVKPSNVLWLDDGSIRLIDFGIAKIEQKSEESALTRTGALPGSLSFMSPEHALGIPSELDERSDLWSLGATMFLLLSGRPVHESQTEVGALALSASKPARSVGEVVSGLPSPLVAVVDRALAFDRQKRFSSAAEMRGALESMTSAPPVRIRRWPYAVAAAAALAALVGLGWSSKPPAVVTEAPRAIISAPLPPARAPEPEREPVVIIEPSIPAPEPVHPPVRKAAPVASTAPSPPRCDPPFFVDPATGTRRVKPGC